MTSTSLRHSGRVRLLSSKMVRVCCCTVTYPIRREEAPRRRKERWKKETLEESQGRREWRMKRMKDGGEPEEEEEQVLDQRCSSGGAAAAEAAPAAAKKQHEGTRWSRLEQRLESSDVRRAQKGGRTTRRMTRLMLYVYSHVKNQPPPSPSLPLLPPTSLSFSPADSSLLTAELMLAGDACGSDAAAGGKQQAS